MAHGIAEVHVWVRRKKVQVVGFGKTNRGVKFIVANTPLAVTKTGDKRFKSELATAVEEMLAQHNPSSEFVTDITYRGG